ncbi:hypothetical protein HJC23_006318 [Cyclotella cryptica]|uniref:Uncharacterized protein n=1 Tax=Cyclotella cryptica TaxID=29204 RepID=A0ABD3P7J6_9STRA
MTEPSQGSHSGGLALLEEWPQQSPCAISRRTSPTLKRVRFADHCERRTYRTDPDYEHAKSYSYADQKIFRKQATSEGLRIKNLVLLCPQRTGRAIHLLLKQGLLSCEELLGIESALSTNPKQESRERRSYIDLVLATQKEMRKQNDDFVDALMLANVAIASSSGRVEKARLRATLAL